MNRSPITRENVWSIFLGVFIAFLPKCTFCLSAYVSLLSALGIVTLPYLEWILPVSVAFFVINIITLGLIAIRRKAYVSFMLSVLGVLLIIIGKFITAYQPILYFGIFAIITSSFFNLSAGKLRCKNSVSNPCKT